MIKRLLKLGVVLSVASPTAMCAAIHLVTSTSVPASDVVLAIDTFNALEGTATQYLALPLCPQAAPVCRTQQISQAVYNNVKAARGYRVALRADLRAATNPDGSVGPVADVSTYNLLATTITSLQDIIQANAPKTGG